MVNLDRLNPASNNYHSCKDFNDCLTKWQKVATLAATLFAAVATLPIFCLGAVAVFRMLVEKFKISNGANSKSVAFNVADTPPKAAIRKSAQEPLYRSSNSALSSTSSAANNSSPPANSKQTSQHCSRTVKAEGYRDFEMMGNRELTQHVEALEIADLATFWGMQKNASGNYKEAKEVAALKKRLPIVIAALSPLQLRECMALDAFWSVITIHEYLQGVASALSAEQLSTICSWLKEFLLTPLDSPAMEALPYPKGGDRRQFLLQTEKYFAKVVENLPCDAAIDRGSLAEKLVAICPSATIANRSGELERAIKMKINVIDPHRRETLRSQLRRALEEYKTSERAVHLRKQTDREIHLTEPLARPRRDRGNSTPPLPSLPEEPRGYVRQKSDSECFELWVNKGNSLAEVDSADRHELLFWILGTVKCRDKATLASMGRFLSSFAQSLPIDGDKAGYLLLEVMSPDHLYNFTQLIDRSALQHLVALEMFATQKYMEKREIVRLNRRLSIEIKAITPDQLATLLPLACFWRLLTAENNKETAATALTVQHFSAIARWLKELQNRERFFLEKIDCEISEIENSLKQLIALIPGDEKKEKEQLAGKLQQICSAATPSLQQVMLTKLQLLPRKDRAPLTQTLKETLSSYNHTKRGF